MADEAQATGIWIFGGSDEETPGTTGAQCGLIFFWVGVVASPITAGPAEPRRTGYFSAERISARLPPGNSTAYISAPPRMRQRGSET